MDGVNKTLYIPLYGKAKVSKKNIILKDSTAEHIWAQESFPLKGKSKSKWLAYYMGMRACAFDAWLKEQMARFPDAVVLHIGCGMDSRAERVGANGHLWYDVDFPDVIKERKRYFAETAQYRMLPGDARTPEWIHLLPKGKNTLIVMEGISMYLQTDALLQLMQACNGHFAHVSLLMDCYTSFAAKISKYKNPINDVGVTTVYGMDAPALLENGTGFSFVKEHSMTPEYCIGQLKGLEKRIFRRIFAGSFSRKMYRLYEYQNFPS